MSGAHPGAAEPRTEVCFKTVATLQLGSVAEPILAVLELRQRSLNEIVRTAPGTSEMFGKLGERPVLVEVQAAGFTLMLGQERAVHVEQPLLPRA
jgi:hypothetical protein